MRILKTLAVTLGFMVWCTVVVALPFMIPNPPGWMFVAWFWVFLGPVFFAFAYEEIR